MPRKFEVVSRGLEKEVIRDFLIYWNASEVARKYGLSAFNVLRYIAYVKKEKPEIFERAEAKLTIDVFKGLEKIITKLDKKVDALENDEAKVKIWLNVIREYREAMKTYADIVERIAKFNKDENIKKAMLAAIQEADPEVGARVLQRLRELQDKKKTLE